MAFLMPTLPMNTSSPIPKISGLAPAPTGGTLKFPERWSLNFRSPSIRFSGSSPSGVAMGSVMKPPKPLPGGGGGGGPSTVGYAV